MRQTRYHVMPAVEVFKPAFSFPLQLAVEYFHEYATLGAAVTLSYFLPIDVSAVFGTPWINFGGEATYSVFNGTWDNFSVGVSWATQHHSALSFTL